MTTRVRPLQARGQHNPRDFDKYVWQVVVPTFDAGEARHARLAALGAEAEAIAAAVPLPQGTRFETLRRLVREAVRETDTGAEIESEVNLLLGPSEPSAS